MATAYCKEPKNQLVKSKYTEISGKLCKNLKDKNDPNESPYMVCPGISGYSLAVRVVDSGRMSIGIIDPNNQEVDLRFPDLITKDMFELQKLVKWRIKTEKNKQIASSLIVTIDVHGNPDQPESVSQTYLAIVKITKQITCVTDRIKKNHLSESKLNQLADTAHSRKCL